MYQIITDTGCDFPTEMYRELQLKVVPLTVNYKGESFTSYDEPWLKDFFAGLRGGETSTTSAVNPEGWKAAIEPALQEGKDALVLPFSSGLSATAQNACIAAEELREAYPDRKIFVVDTLAASLGQGLLVWYACQKRDEGLTVEELAAWVEENRFRLCHWFTVDDLMYLKRGGRISAATALVGTMLQIKPVLHVDDEGHLINVSKARGRRASLDALCAKLEKDGLPGENDTVFICHGDCQADVDYMTKKLTENYGVKKVFAYYVGAVIGSHSGPGTLAFFFLGDKR